MIEYLIANAEKLVIALTALITLASALANLTPTETDNKIVAALSKVINVLALNLKK